MTDVLVFNVNGTPAPQGSKRARAIYKGRGKAREFTGRVAQVEMSKKVKPWRQAVVDAAQHAIGAVGMFDDWVPYTGPVHVAIEFRIRRPLSHYRTGRFANLLRDNAPDFVITAPDTDKACRSNARRAHPGQGVRRRQAGRVPVRDEGLLRPHRPSRRDHHRPPGELGVTCWSAHHELRLPPLRRPPRNRATQP
jgi:hypothetical protein